MYRGMPYVLVVAAIILGVASTAPAAPVSFDLFFFNDLSMDPQAATNLNLEASAKAGSNAVTELNGVYKFPFSGAPPANQPDGPAGPQTDIISLIGGTVFINAAPVSLPTNQSAVPTTTRITIDTDDWAPLSLTNLNIDMLNGSLAQFQLNVVRLDTINDPPGIWGSNAFIDVSISGNFDQLKFYQTGASSFTPDGFGFFDFQVPGTLVGVLDIDLGVNLFNDISTSISVETQEFETAFTLSGKAFVYDNGFGGAGVLLDNTANPTVTSIDLSGISTTLSLGIADPPVTFAASLQVDAAIDLSFAFGLSDFDAPESAVVPEPGTFVLIAIGAIGLVPIIRRRLRKS